MTFSVCSKLLGITCIWSNLCYLSLASIHALTLEAGQVLLANEPCKITWEADFASTVQIELLYGHDVNIGNITGRLSLSSVPGANFRSMLIYVFFQLRRPTAAATCGHQIPRLQALEIISSQFVHSTSQTMRALIPSMSASP